LPHHADAAPAPPPPEKKRGFWSRIFGRNRPDPATSEQAPTKKKRGG
jgi:hypothetical protein